VSKTPLQQPQDVLVLRPVTGTVEVIEPLSGGDGPRRYQLLSPRGPNEWVLRALRDTPLRLLPHDSAEFGEQSGRPASAKLRGTWARADPLVRLKMRGRVFSGVEAWLDGYLYPPGDGRDGTWSLDGIFSGGTGVSRVLARVRHTLAASRAPSEPAPSVPPSSPAPERSSLRAQAASVFGVLWPAFDVTVTPTEGFAEAQSHRASLIIIDPARTDDHQAKVTLACSGPIGAGWIAWTANLPEETARADPNRVEVRSPPATLPYWYDADLAFPRPLQEARLRVRYSATDYTVRGDVTAVSTDGTRYSADLRGGLRSPAVEAMRPGPAHLGLSGCWEGVFGPASKAWLPGDIEVADLAGLRVSADGDVTREPFGEPWGFLRHAQAEDLALGLVGPARQESLVILRRRDAAITGLADLGPGDADALRVLAQATLVDGFTATARPMLDRAAALLDEDTEQAWISRVLLLNYQVQAEFELRDYPRLISCLRTAVALRHRLLAEASPWTWARRIVTERVGSERTTLTAFPPSVPRIEAATRIIDSVDQAAAQEPGDAVLTLTGLGEMVDALLASLRSATASLRELSQAELGENEALLGPDLAARRTALVDASCSPLPEDPPRLAEARADLDEREERFRADVASRHDVGPGQRQAYLNSYIIAVILSGVARRLELTTQLVERTELPASLQRRITSSREGLSSLTRYIEQWRSLFAEDADRIQAVEGSQGFYADLVRFLLGLDAPREAFLASELARARAFADLLRQSGRPGAPQAAPVIPTTEALVSARAEARQTIIEYFLLEDEVVTWLVTPGGDMSVYRAQISRARLTEAIAELHTLLTARRPTHRERARTSDLLQQLGDQLWRPLPRDALPRDPDEPVILIPHGPLFQVPFAALRDGDAQPLVEKHALISAPAAAMLPQLLDRRLRRPRGPQQCLAMISPSPMPAPGLRELTRVTPERFQPISAFYPPGSCVVWHGPDATWTAFRRDAADADVLIFATHAEAVDAPGTDSMDSFIALAPAQGHDGMVRARDLIDLELGAQVAILSACHTGAGRITGDGLIGLSRAFLTAGPATLLMTLYETGELISLDLVYRFHAYWKGTGLTAAAALRRALSDLHRETEGREVRLWAPFVLFGLDTAREEA